MASRALHGRRAQLERDLRAKAVDHAARRLATSAYLAEHDRISAEIDALQVQVGPQVGDVDEVIGALTSMRDAWHDADLEQKAQLVARVYQRIIVQDGAIVGVELTEAAKRLGFLAALPETVVMARPAGARGPQTTVVRIPILGRERLRRSRSA